MADDQLHYPPGAEPTPEPEPIPEPTPVNQDPNPEPAPEPTPEPAPEDEPTPDPEETPEQEPQNLNNPRRTIYESLKEKKVALKDAKQELAVAQTRIAELEGLLQNGKNAQTPADTANNADDLAKFAEENDLDAEGLKKVATFLAEHIGGKVPTDIQKTLDEIKTWKSERVAADTRVAEDAAIDAQASTVKTTLASLGHEIHVDAEHSKVMAEIKRLAHTKEYHDKPVAYIAWAEREKLGKMISPKKASFEAPTPNNGEPVTKAPDFSNDKGHTPESVERAIRSPGA